VVASGGFLGLGDEYFAVPWEALTLSDSKEQFVLNMKEEQLKDILGFVMYHFYDRSSAVVRRLSSNEAFDRPPFHLPI